MFEGKHIFGGIVFSNTLSNLSCPPTRDEEAQVVLVWITLDLALALG